MKLRNKKTGEIREIPDGFFCCDNLKKICKEWEDYEEPKEYWYINTEMYEVDYYEKGKYYDIEKFNKEIGNYFETEEEAELALRKLKAWKRLKDKGFRFTDDLVYGEYYGCGSIRFIIFPSKEEKYVKDDLELLFGGEE